MSQNSEGGEIEPIAEIPIRYKIPVVGGSLQVDNDIWLSFWIKLTPILIFQVKVF